MEIRYRNWTFVEGIAYPMHVVMMQDHQIMQEVRVDRVKVNPVLTGDLFDMTSLRRQWSRPAGPEEENGTVPPPRLLPPLSE